MPNSCVVPQCKTGYKSLKVKRSTFKVPRNVDLFKKWQAAIPGNVQLNSSHFVCEKHFEEQCINRQWVKRDLNGKIIAAFTYQHPRLHDGAVPTLFHDTGENIDGKPIVTENSETITKIIDTPVEDIPVVEDITINKTTLLKNYHVMVEAENSLIDLSPSIEDISMILRDESSTVCKVGVEVENAAISMDDAAVTENPQLILDQQNPTTVSEIHQAPVPDSPLETQKSCFNVSRPVISQCHEFLRSGVCSEKFSATLPKCWAFNEMLALERQYALFTYSVMRVMNGVDSPVAQRSVTLDIQGKLRYHVYGHPIHGNDIDLAQCLNNTESLPNVLEKFQYMNICSSIGNVNLHCIPQQSAFSDYLDGWRANECSLLSKKKRCDRCTKLRRTVLQKEKHLKSGKINHVFQLSNPLDRIKLAAMRKKLQRQRRMTYNAKSRMKILMQSLEDKKAEIAAIQDQTLDEKCSNLKVSATQKTALKEIISAATKKTR